MSLQEFHVAAKESLRIDWVVLSANIVGVGVVAIAAAYARMDGPALQATIQASLF